MGTRILELTDGTAAESGDEIEVSRLASAPALTATDISFAASDQSLNSAAGALVSAGLVEGMSVVVAGASNGANEFTRTRIVTLTATKATFDGLSIVDESAGASVSITPYVSRRVPAPVDTPAVQTITTASTVTPVSTDDLVEITAQAAALTVADPSGTPANGWGLVIRIKDDGTSRAITWGSGYRAIGVTLPTATVVGKQHYIGAIYNGAATKWDVVAVGVQA